MSNRFHVSLITSYIRDYSTIKDGGTPKECTINFRDQYRKSKEKQRNKAIFSGRIIEMKPFQILFKD